MTSTGDNDKPTSVAAVIAARRADREAKEQRRVDPQTRAEKRHPAYRRNLQ